MLACVPAVGGTFSAYDYARAVSHEPSARAPFADAALPADAPEAFRRHFARPQSPAAGEPPGKSLMDIYLRSRARFKRGKW